MSCLVAALRLLLLSLPLWAGLAGVEPAAAQSLFAGAARAAVPMFDQPAARFYPGATGTLMANRPAPLVEARALALTDRDGIAARRERARGLLDLPLAGSPYRPPPVALVRRQAQDMLENVPRDFAHENDLMCIAVSIYHESRGQPREGQAAVASVILNRAMDPERWGNTPCEVVIPVQFSYLKPDRSFAPIRNGKAWAEAVEIGAEVLLRGPDPSLHGADHYHATYVDPKWNREMDWIARIRDHIFWKSRPKPT